MLKSIGKHELTFHRASSVGVKVLASIDANALVEIVELFQPISVQIVILRM